MTKFLNLGFITMIVASSAHARLGPPVLGGANDLGDAVERADAAIVALVLDERELSGKPADRDRPPLRSLTLEIKQVIFGEVESPIQVELARADDLSGGSTAGFTSLMFLKRKEDGALRALVAPEQYPIGHWPGSFPKTRRDGTRSVLLYELVKGNASERERVLGYLRELKDSQAIPAIRETLPTAKGRMRGKTLAALIRLGDVSALADAIAHVEAIPTTAPDAEQWGVGLIAAELYHVKSPEAVPALLQAARSKHKLLREEAVYALRQMRRKETVPALVEALSDTDADVRYQALMGLWETVGKNGSVRGAPSRPLFDENPESHLKMWKDWWVREGRNRVWTSQPS